MRPSRRLPRRRTNWSSTSAPRITSPVSARNCGPHPPHQAEQDAALKDLHVRYVRVAINWSIPAADLTAQSQLSVDDLTALIKKHDTPRFDDSVARFATEIKTLGIEMHFIFFMMPKCWLIQAGPSSWHANPDEFENGANWITAQLIRAKAAGLVPSHIEITNEPEGDWNTLFTPEQYDAYLVAVRKALDANGLQDIKIAGPGCGTGVAPHLADPDGGRRSRRRQAARYPVGPSLRPRNRREGFPAPRPAQAADGQARPGHAALHHRIQQQGPLLGQPRPTRRARTSAARRTGATPPTSAFRRSATGSRRSPRAPTPFSFGKRPTRFGATPITAGST